MNVLGREWNLQTWYNYYQMQAGRLAPRYSTDYSHVHISFENGSIDSDLVSRFVDYHYGRIAAEDDVTPLELMNYTVTSGTLGNHTVADLLKAGYQANVRAAELEDKVAQLELDLAALPKAFWNYQLASSLYPTPLAAGDLIKKGYEASAGVKVLEDDLAAIKTALHII